MTDKSFIYDYITLIDQADFSKITYSQFPEYENHKLAKVLVAFYEGIANRSKKHPCVALALNASTVESTEIPLYPLYKLKKLGVLLAFIQSFNNAIYESYVKRLAGWDSFSKTLFELQIGCMLKLKDPKVEFYEWGDPVLNFPPDFHAKLENGKDVWIEAYVRERDKDFFDHFIPNESGQVIPKPGHEIDAILREFAKTTCDRIRGKRKKSIPKEDIFITVVHPLDRYSCGSVNFQAFANSLPQNDTVVVCHSEFYGADNLAKERKRIYTNVNSQLDSKELNYLNGLFS